MSQGPDDETRDAEADASALAHALDVFTAGCEGRLLFDDAAIDLKYVFDPASGRVLAAAPVAIFFSAQLILSVPEETDDALQLLLSPEEVGESVLTDRWQAYHGAPEHVRWALFWVDSARHGPWVFDGDAFALPNPLAPAEVALCRMLNEDKARLTALCQRFAGVVVPQPVCVGVDPRGVHVRARFGVVRLRFDDVQSEEAGAREAIEAMCHAI